MITDKDTNFLYLADCLPTKCPAFFEQLEHLLITHNVGYGLIPQTKDIWAVDYMPIQVDENDFVQFVYNPDYLQSKRWQKTIPNVDGICRTMIIDTTKSSIIVDGGNVIKTQNKVIMCDKVFHENPNIRRHKLIAQLEVLLQVNKVVFIPTHPKDYTGHADAIVRFVDNNTVVTNCYDKEPEYQQALYIALHNADINCIEIPYNPYQNKSYSSANGVYINYLQIGKIIIAPVFGIEDDELAIKKLQGIFTGCNIYTIECNEIADMGGVLNCISWNIKK